MFSVLNGLWKDNNIGLVEVFGEFDGWVRYSRHTDCMQHEENNTNTEMKHVRFWPLLVQRPSISSGNFTKNSIFHANFRKISIFRKCLKTFEFQGKNWPFTATSWQIIPFFFKSHHFRTYFLNMIRYNNNNNNFTTRPRPTRPPMRPPTTPAQNLGVATSQPPGLTPLSLIVSVYMYIYVFIL